MGVLGWVLPKDKSTHTVDLSGNCQYSFPACYGIRPLRCPFCGRFAGLSECRFSVPAPESHRSVVSLSSSQTLYRSFPCKHENSLTPLFLLSPKSLTTFWGPDGLGKIISHPAGHSVITGFEIQSRNCPLHLSDRRQFRAVQKRRYFLLAYRWRCPAESRLSHSNVKNDIQLSLSFASILLYITEQVFVKIF